jgi:hypothetical protein
LWTVAILTLLWNGSGAVTILLAQAGRLTGISADEAAYYAAQPFWLVFSTNIATLAPVAAGSRCSCAARSRYGSSRFRWR